MALTRWHEGDTLEGAFDFFEYCLTRSCNDIELTRSLILHIADEPDEGRMRAADAAMLAANDRPHS